MSDTPLLYLKVKVRAGSLILETCEQAIALSRRTLTVVEFDFNSVTVLARWDDDPNVLAENWDKALRSDYPIKIAGGRRITEESGE